MRYRSILITFLFLALGLPGLEARESVVVTEIIDGQTLQLSDGRKIRLIGVAARRPDLQGDEHKDEAQLSYRAKKYIQKTIKGKPVIISHDPQFANKRHVDLQGRSLAYVWYSIYFRESVDEGGAPFGISAKEKLLNAEVIKQGYGFAERVTEYNQKKAFLRYEQEAEAASKGLWGVSLDNYADLLDKAIGARQASISTFLTASARRISYETAEKTFQEAINFNAEDYRAYYERSWLGADERNDSVRERSLEDIEKAIALSPRNPKCYAQKHYILRLLDRHAEAGGAYKKAVDLAAKFGMISIVSGLVQDELYSGDYPFFPEDEKFGGYVEDGIRATLNEDHFLFFMARYKSRNLPQTPETEAFFNQLLQDMEFQQYYEKYAEFLSRANSREVIYKTTWAKKGGDTPEDVLKAMEREKI